MPLLTSRVSGTEKTAATLQRYRKRYGAKTMNRKVLTSFRAANEKEVNIRTGRLQRSFRFRTISLNRFRVTWLAPYAVYVEARTPFVSRVVDTALRYIPLPFTAIPRQRRRRIEGVGKYRRTTRRESFGR